MPQIPAFGVKILIFQTLPLWPSQSRWSPAVRTLPDSSCHSRTGSWAEVGRTHPHPPCTGWPRVTSSATEQWGLWLISHGNWAVDWAFLTSRCSSVTLDRLEIKNKSYWWPSYQWLVWHEVTTHDTSPLIKFSISTKGTRKENEKKKKCAFG